MDAEQPTHPRAADARPAEAPLALVPHPWRGVVLGEVHARPFHPVRSPLRVLHFAFLTSAEEAAAAHSALQGYCRERGIAEPRPGAKHHRAVLAGATLLWEQHSEFSTYTWQFDGFEREPFERPARQLGQAMADLPQPGLHLASVDLHLMAERPDTILEEVFDPTSLAASSVSGRAVAGSDFQVTADGFVRYLVLDRGLEPSQAGAVVQRLLELETYRILALLGLPEAARLSPSIGRAEAALVRITQAMTEAQSLDANRALLDELTPLAAASEAEAALSSYRFGASRAYDGIVQQRLATLAEVPLREHPTLAGFLARRMAPAMRTCTTISERQAALARRLAQAADLLRTRVDVEIEQQNRDVLVAMNERTRLQLQMQRTVEGLSIAAISYYVVGLASYVFDGAKAAGLPIEPGVATAISVPVTLVGVGLIVHRIRKAHAES